MQDVSHSRVILRRLKQDATPSAQAASLIDNAAGMVVLDKRNPSMLLVEGQPELISAMVQRLNGWSAFPLATVERPDTRVRIVPTV
ncbi:hypothetical protein [Azospirillum sp. B4]|uniref:hypothetical protein n=1 Tax=Azospirillum sp. B4 TaxID=95605 RepID=UPI00034D1351|nr:hypothetical protein [Azospirillum sp. B4]